MSVQELFKRKGLTLGGYVLAFIIILNTILFLSFYLQHRKNLQHEKVTAFLFPRIENLKNDISATENLSASFISSRSQQDFEQYTSLVQTTSRDLDSLIYHLKRLQTNDAQISKVEKDIGEMLSQQEEFLSIVEQGDSAAIVNASLQIPQSFPSANTALAKSLTFQKNNSGDQFTNIINALGVNQVVLLIGIPLLILLIRQQIKSKEKLVAFNHDVEESNRKYVFNAMDEVDYENDELIRERLLANLKKASEFIQQVADGNYAIRWEGITDENRSENKHNIAGELIRMREQMKQVKDQDEKRIWTTEGLSTFGELIRKHQDNLEALGDNFISNAVKYLKAKAGGLFVLETQEDGTQYLELKACYAYERKKFITKRVEIGQGLIGQTFLEAQTINLKDVPNEYLLITSGLGGANPNSLVLIPLRTNERVEGVLELASFNEFQEHEIQFLEKIGEQLASSLISVRSAEKTKSLLEVSQQQSEEMRAQEEEMRQNMEELEATQEQLQRQMNEMDTLKQKLEKEQYLFGALMSSIPDAIYFKDTESKFLRVSAYLASHFKASEEALIGKSDFDFQDESHAREAFEDEKNIMQTRKPKVDYVEKEVLADGTEHYVSTTKMPLVDLHGEVVGTFGISRDVTNLKQLEQSVKKKEQELREEEQQHKLKLQQLQEALEKAQEELELLKKK